MLKSFQIHAYENGTLGLHLTRAPWDPYPWISSIQTDSSAYAAGLRIGDTVLEFNNCDILGLKISEIVLLLKSHWLQDARVKSNTNSNSNDNNSETDNNDNCRHYVTMVIWRNEAQASVVDETHNKDCNAKDEDAETNAHNINQQSLQKFATCLQHIAQLLECPVCLEVIKPPGWQCCNGHVLCNNCRSRSVKCPVCRVPLGPRGRCLLSDKLFTLLAESFPCDGVRSNKNSPKEGRKCSPEIHNHPKMAVDIVQRKKKVQQRRQQDFDAKDKNKEKQRQQQKQQQQQLQEQEQNQEEQQEHRQLRNADISGVCLSFRTRCTSSEVHQMKKTFEQSSLVSQVKKNGQQKEKQNEKQKDAVGDQKSKVSLEAIHDKNVYFVKDKIKSVSNSGNSSPDYAADELIVPRTTSPTSSSSLSSSSSSSLSLQLSSSSFCNTLIPTTAISTTTVTLTTQVNQITDRECDDLLVQHQHPYEKRKQQSTIVTNINSQQGFCASTCSYFCRCCKQDKLPTVNNGVITTKTAAADQNKFIYPSIIKATTEQAYQNYRCPTGKLCCLKYVLSCTKATDVSATAGTCRRNSFRLATHNQMTNNHLSTTTTTTTITKTTKEQQQITRKSTPTNHSNSSTSSSSPSSLPSSLSMPLSSEGIGDDIGIGLNDEWEILMHLGRDHLIHVCHHYAEYGQRIAMQLPTAYSDNSNDCNKSNYCNKSIICLNFKGVTTTNLIEKFFITCIPLALEQELQHQIHQQEQQQYEKLLENKTFSSTCITSCNLKKYAIFLWYLNPKHSLNYSPVSSNDEDDDVSNFESIIEIPNTDIKWFGRVHHLTTPWSQILASREFLMYDAISDGYDEAFVIVNKTK